MSFKVLSIVGARPQFIKAAVVSRVVRACPEIREVLVHTGQHYDANMSERFFSELDIPEPDHNLGVGSGSHAAQTGRMLAGLEALIERETPRAVILYGDTNSTVAGALAAAKLGVPVVHVEAGLRSFNRRMPEEINRIVADHLADLLLTPTETANRNLEREGIDPGRVVFSGDVMFDAARFYAARAAARSRVIEEQALAPRGYVLVTLHRAENTDDPDRLRVIVDGLARVAETLPVLWPLHPRTRAALDRAGHPPASFPGRLRTIDPVGYLDMIRLEQNAAVVATDSGGVQKEAFFHQVPCVTLRTETEWVELVAAGCNRLCPPESAERVQDTILGAIGVEVVQAGFYGSGRAGEAIVEALLQRYSPDGSGDRIVPSRAARPAPGPAVADA